MKKSIIICMTFAMMIAGCRKVDVDFTYSPTAPRAGETVKFTNTSSAGEEWAWNFGDNTTSVVKNPSHIFKKPGEYIVTLMVDSARYNTCSHIVTVYDTVPTFVASTDSICHYIDMTFTASVYNPFNHNLSYQWALPSNCVLTAGTLNSRSITVYFKEYGKTFSDSVCVRLAVTQKDTTYNCLRHFFIHKTKAPAIVMEMTNRTVQRQHLINDYLTGVENGDEEDVRLLEISSDTMIEFNDSIFYASKMTIFPDLKIHRLQIDPMVQKWYITTAEGLYVANFNGKNLQLIDSDATGGLFVDTKRNQIYWATSSGLKAMSLIKSKNNLFSTQPILYNHLSDIDRIVVNNNYK